MANAIFLISCPDQKGITAAVTGFIAQHHGNIIHADQHIDTQSNTFLMRLEWCLEGFDLKRHEVQGAFAPIASNYGMQWEMYATDDKPRVAVFTGKQLHCVQDLVYRYRSGQFNGIFPLIVSNHLDAKDIAAAQGIDFVHYTVLAHTKLDQEKAQLALLEDYRIDVVVLARYQQVLSPNFVKRFPNRIINIHHSFLPAFVGKDPYGQAYEKGVKVIGATSHFVTETLDDGPIIAQDTVDVSHRDDLADMKHKGEDLERMVLSRAVKWYLERKILCYGRKTAVFA